MKLVLADDLRLPLDAVTQTFGILSVRGGGKSNTAAVMAEQMAPVRQITVGLEEKRRWIFTRRQGHV